MAGVSFFLVAINNPPKIKSETNPAPVIAVNTLEASNQYLKADTTSTEGRIMSALPITKVPFSVSKVDTRELFFLKASSAISCIYLAFANKISYDFLLG